ncbi:MAG: neutral/alkaline non-lysosomal ceramidase N-terminal domain-containing protein [Lentisphaerae bacterium]|nr:neutral/alkaline non-lysosomal ceramidase N-terminal domain-containing protein [Lentisphaerota bacterium]
MTGELPGLKAGTGQADISPREPMFLWGYPHVERISTDRHDALYATALCLDDGQHCTLSVGVDVLYVDAICVAECRRRIEVRTGVPPSHVLISATHTHSGPVTCDILAMTGDPLVPHPDPAYVEQMIQGIVDAACTAYEARRPAELAVTTAQIDGVGGNRLSPDAVRDPEAGLVVVRQRAAGNILAVQLFYAMHPTVMHEDSTLVSSDFPAFTRLHIQEAYPGVQTIYHNGTCGNLSPRYHVTGQTFAEAERLGRRLGGFIIAAIDALTDADFRCDVVVGGVSDHAQLPPRTFASVATAAADLEEARDAYGRLKVKGAGHGPVRTAQCVVFGAEEVVTMAEAQESGALEPIQTAHARAEVQLLRVGDLCIVGLPGECFVEYGLEIKQRASGRAFVTSMANGELQGYITTPDATGYEANLSMFKPEAGAILVDMALNLMQKL